MKKINFDNDSIQNNIIPPLNAAISSLNRAKGSFDSVGIPGGFPYGGFVKGCGGKIGNITSKLSNIRDDINTTNGKLDIVINNGSLNINNISISKIAK